MEAINVIWGACGLGVGVLFSTIVLTIAAFHDDMRGGNKK